MHDSNGENSPIDPAQMVRIEGLHRGFLYQHLYAASCILLASQHGGDVVVEQDEDIEVVYPDERIYIQVKTRTAPLRASDISQSIIKYETLRQEHALGNRAGRSSLIIVTNTQLSAGLTARVASAEWPKDISVLLHGVKPNQRIPGSPANVDDALRIGTELASTVPFRGIRAESLVLKLAALVQRAAAGADQHRFTSDTFANLFEVIASQLHGFPPVPIPYRPQRSEPDISSPERVRLLTGFSGAGKTAWASQMANITDVDFVYFDCNGTPSSAVAAGLAREIIAQFLARHDHAAATLLIPENSGTAMLRAIDKRMAASSIPAHIVVDNIHELNAATVRSLIEALGFSRLTLIAQPWKEGDNVAALPDVRQYHLDGWDIDTVASELSMVNSKADRPTVQRLHSITAGMPLFVRNAALLVRDRYHGDTAAFCNAIDAQTHSVETAQEFILSATVEALSTIALRVFAAIGQCVVPLEHEEMLTIASHFADSATQAAVAIRELGRAHVLLPSAEALTSFHDAFRIIANQRLSQMGAEESRQVETLLLRIMGESLQKRLNLARFQLWLRLLVITGDIETLVDVAIDEMVHEIGGAVAITAALQDAATSEELPAELRFYAFDALAFWDAQRNEGRRLIEYIGPMKKLIAENGLGDSEFAALATKTLTAAANAGNRKLLEEIYVAGSTKLQGDTLRLRILRYTYARGLWKIGLAPEAAAEAGRLISDYYSALKISPDDIIGLNPIEMVAKITWTDTTHDELKHLADSLDLFATTSSRPNPIARIHAMKFYELAHAYRSAVRVGQDLVDEMISLQDPAGARSLMETCILPILRSGSLTDLEIDVRAQYAVVLARTEDFIAARQEIRALMAYEVTDSVRKQLDHQSQMIEELAEREEAGGRLGKRRVLKIGRNELCPCESGKKYKRCHGA